MIRILPAVSLILLICFSCDRPAPRPLPATAPAEPVFDLDLKPLTPLLPNRPTHVAVDQLGNVYWVQETDRSDDTMFVIGEGDVPQATQLSVANVGALMGASGASGNIHGIAAGPRGEIYFYFSASQARKSFACLGMYTPKTAALRILADTDAVAAAAGMGRSLPLARASVVSEGRLIWIWLRHSDAWAIFNIDTSKLAPSGPAPLRKTFDVVKLEGKPLELTREEMEISPAGDGSIFLLNPPAAQFLKIDSSGNAKVARSLIGLPSILSTPAVDRQGKILLFAANAELIGAKPDDPNAPNVEAPYPAMLVLDNASEKVTVIGREHVQAYPGFPVFGMRLRQLVPHPGEEAWITYDAGSGELLRVKIHEKLWP